MIDLREAGDGERVAVSTARLAKDVRATTRNELALLVDQLSAVIAEDWADAPVVPFYLQKSEHAVALILAALRCGKAFVSINPKVRSKQIQEILSALGMTACLTDESMAPPLARMLKSDSEMEAIKWWCLPSQEAETAEPPTVARLREAGAIEPLALDGREADRVSLASFDDRPDDLGCVLFTSGSTGRPKGVKVSRGDLMARARAEAEWFGLSRDDVLLSVLPLSFDVGLNQLFAALVAEARIVLSESWLPADLLNLAGGEGVTGISGVPAIWQGLLGSGIDASQLAGLASLRYLTVSGGSLAEPDLRALAELLPAVKLFKTYGQTEAFRAVSLHPSDLAERLGSVGRAFTGVEVYILDEEGRRCQPDEVGEVVHCGLGTMMGYLEGDEEGKLRPNPLYPHESAFPNAVFTGDYGYLDADGYLFLKGRRDGMAKIMGNRVYPLEVEQALRSLDGVSECAVGKIEADGADALAAFLTATPGHELAPLELKRALANRVPGYMIPHALHVVPEIPLTASGKPDLPRLLHGHAGPQATA